MITNTLNTLVDEKSTNKSHILEKPKVISAVGPDEDWDTAEDTVSAMMRAGTLAKTTSIYLVNVQVADYPFTITYFVASSEKPSEEELREVIIDETGEPDIDVLEVDVFNP